MAMTVNVDDDHWPSLAPIRTSATPACLPACDTICKNSILQEGRCTLQAYGHGTACSCATVSSRSRPITASCMPSAAPFDACPSSLPDCSKASNTDLVRQSSRCYTSKKTCINSFSCFFCTKPTSSPRPQRRCTPTCMRKNGPVLRSMAFLFPAGSFQSFYSSPRGKAAQLSGAFPRTLSAGKLQHVYASPRTPGNHPICGKFNHFSSPRTPGSGNLQCLSAPRTPASGKVQHFSGAIPSPRTPFGSGAASPSSARRRQSSFTLFMPPNATADKKKAADHQQDEPTSPHVTCIGRVRRQTHCKKPHPKDIINPHDTKAKKKGAYSKKTHSESGLSTCRSNSSNEAMKSIMKISTMEACKQKFGRNHELDNPHKIHGFGDECDIVNNPDQIDLECNQGDDITPIANGNIKDLVHQLDFQNHGRQFLFSDLECIDGNMRSLEEADHGIFKNIKMHTITSSYAEFTEYDIVKLSTDTPVADTILCSQIPHDLQQEAHDQSQCLESLSELQQHEAHKSQCQNPSLHLNTCTTPQSIDHCLLSIRSNSSRKLSD